MRVVATGFLAMTLLAGCGDPLQDVPRLQDVPLAAEQGQADALADPTKTDAPVAEAAQAPKPIEAEKPRKGLLGFLRRQADSAKADENLAAVEADVSGQVDAADGAKAAAAEAADPAIQQAALTPDDSTAEKPKRKGLFARRDKPEKTPVRAARAPQPGDPDYQTVAIGTRLPYGEMARLCGVPTRSLGSKAGQYPEKGKGFTLYDSNAGSTAARTFYVTGFKDGCARQFTAALVLFASPDSYETIRFGPAGKSQPRAKTDAAYDVLKSRVCRVEKGEPCGRKIVKLEKNTAFLTVYERFGSNARWKNILLHDGEVLASDIKG